MMFPIKNEPLAFGLDLSDTTIKIAKLRRAGRQHAVDLLEEFVIPPGLITNGEIQNIDNLGKELNQLLLPFKKQLPDGVITALPEAKTFIQTIVLPKKENSVLSEQLETAIPEYLPLPLEEMYLDNAIIEETSNDWTVIIGAAPKTVVDDYIKLLESLNFLPVALDIQGTAIARAVIPETEPIYYPRVIIDIGRHCSNLIVHDHHSVQFCMSLPISGENITNGIAAELNLSNEQAEKAKIMCGLDPEKCEGVVKKILEESTDKLTTRVNEAKVFYQDHFPNPGSIKEIILTGGGAYLINLDTYLSDILKVPTRLGNPWENIHLKGQLDKKPLLKYATVIGLAIRGVDSEPTI